MKRRFWLPVATVMAAFFWTGCVYHDTDVGHRGRRVHVRAPFTSVDVVVPDDDADTHVDVVVDD